ncbi:cbb3-type cytochrome oxidase assembly protein CcoS [Vibrio sp. S17_S38]|uniref:cbb3-type cytochrome oxidase assembly protein CcoS n=1 Tax=Vibrio sp. S17_S38 TaxID=2720229 RepID=UPI00168039E4|nr:cbb3-type cytochrome oxidase assembly protein CcoS [Vibrio sp. S17_S38]MBD1574678.1 cbb3-type cytochrome oxidase assembly protein CcoS [Vibrio sp. S17_S38]
MESLYILIPIAIVFVCIAVAIFIWAVKSDQFDDLDRQGHSIFFDDNEDKPKVNHQSDEKAP